ncbi:ABC transporter substrate-binding protein [Peribacillus cavernae]|uniref:ABC transporter substrate-binding protein n=1 Tax=Peribacillus cavernae TaxID=1674310 RepID=A0A433HFS6_9BACI|nr:ABC transporter substrate-binding protein [Peribacillus cavernae]MDQ0219815.1 multiple sugar transport system substrate-binding protein [Peribacillus cavernae]RUQ27207.1 ABC transporter substrate-binding protein [Peribacillus cavernae]
MARGFRLGFVLILLFSVILSACSGGSDASDKNKDGKVVVNFQTFWGSETRKPVIDKIVSDFNKSQDEIEVKHTFVPWGDIWTKNTAAVAAGNPADVIVNDLHSVAHRAKNGQTEDLSQYLGEDLKNTLYPNLWDSALYQDKVHGVPFATDNRLLFYNKDAYKEAGLDPEKPPTTWQELEEHAKKLDVKKGNSYERVGYYPLWGSFGAASWMSNADDGKGFIEGDKMYFATANKIEGLEWVADWQKRLGKKNVQAFEAEFGSGQTNPFISEKVAIWTDTANFYTQIRDSKTDMNFGVAPIPAFKEGGRNWNEGGGFVMEVPKGAEHPKEAATFIEYLTSEKVQSYWAEKNFDIVANKKAADSVVNALEGDGKLVYESAINNLKDTPFHSVPVKYPDYKSIVDPIIDNAVQGKISPEQALKKAEKDVKNSAK